MSGRLINQHARPSRPARQATTSRWRRLKKSLTKTRRCKHLGPLNDRVTSLALEVRLPKYANCNSAGSFVEFTHSWQPQVPPKKLGMVLASWKQRLRAVFFLVGLSSQFSIPGKVPPRKPLKGSRLPKKGALVDKPVEIQTFGTIRQRPSAPREIPNLSKLNQPGVFGATQRANTKYLSVRGCRERLARLDDRLHETYA